MTLEPDMTADDAAAAAANMTSDQLREIGALVPNTVAMTASLFGPESDGPLALTLALCAQQLNLDRAFLAAGLGDAKPELMAAFILTLQQRGDASAAVAAVLQEVAAAGQGAEEPGSAE